ncbi:MAG: hypothetical protein ACYC6Y_05660 [Thermoguttaceae bacterium]
MHTVDLVKEATLLARSAGYRIRQECLGGALGGGCEFGGQKWIFLDVALGPVDQLAQIVEALRLDPEVAQRPMSDPLRMHLVTRKSA